MTLHNIMQYTKYAKYRVSGQNVRLKKRTDGLLVIRKLKKRSENIFELPGTARRTGHSTLPALIIFALALLVIAVLGITSFEYLFGNSPIAEIEKPAPPGAAALSLGNISDFLFIVALPAVGLLFIGQYILLTQIRDRIDKH